MSLSNFIKSILNIQDNNISFPEEDYCQVIQNGNNVISNLFPFKITILSLILVYRGTSAKIVKKNLSKKEKVSKQMLTTLKTLKKYMKYIENMFESKITNGLIEGLNNKIKSI